MINTFSAVAMALVTPLATIQVPAPQPMVTIADINMPKFVPTSAANDIQNVVKEESAVSICHQLRNDFSISNTEMSKWLGVKRRTFYNWIKAPEKSIQFGSQIENRLATLLKLKDAMELEHHKVLHKIAFSPIYGDAEFGKMILNGASDIVLIDFYEQLFSQFESYRKLNSNSIV